MTSVKDLTGLYDYSYWANRKIFDVLSHLSPDEFTRQVAGSYGSARNTMVHIMSAEWGWLDRCGGMQRGPALVATDYPTAASVIDRWRQVEVNVRSFLASLRDEDLDQLREFPSAALPASSAEVTFCSMLQSTQFIIGDNWRCNSAC